jgi:excisionase family DNA binding protein
MAVPNRNEPHEYYAKTNLSSTSDAGVVLSSSSSGMAKIMIESRTIRHRKSGPSRRAVVITTVDTRGSAPIRWHERPFLSVTNAAAVLGCSKTRVYALAKEGALKFVTLAGRTLVTTPSVTELVDAARPWVPSDRATAARAARTNRLVEAA